MYYWMLVLSQWFNGGEPGPDPEPSTGSAHHRKRVVAVTVRRHGGRR